MSPSARPSVRTQAPPWFWSQAINTTTTHQPSHLPPRQWRQQEYHGRSRRLRQRPRQQAQRPRTPGSQVDKGTSPRGIQRTETHTQTSSIEAIPNTSHTSLRTHFTVPFSVPVAQCLSKAASYVGWFSVNGRLKSHKPRFLHTTTPLGKCRPAVRRRLHNFTSSSVNPPGCG